MELEVKRMCKIKPLMPDELREDEEAGARDLAAAFGLDVSRVLAQLKECQRIHWEVSDASP